MMLIMMTMNIMFFFMNHPMSMGLVMITQTLMMAVWSGLIMKTFWMSYILTITMLSGMLVLFIYMSSVASNEKFKNSMKMWMLFSIMMSLAIVSLLLSKKMIIKNNYFSVGMEVNKMGEILFLNKMFSMGNIIITLMMVTYLFLAMIVSSNIVNISEGPMRLKI